MAMEEILHKALEMIARMEIEKLSIRVFIKQHPAFFENMQTASMIAPECRTSECYSESGYVFLIGSYIYYLSEGRPATWFERRRFAWFSDCASLYKRTLCSCPRRRFQSIGELKSYLQSIC